MTFQEVKHKYLLASIQNERNALPQEKSCLTNEQICGSQSFHFSCRVQYGQNDKVGLRNLLQRSLGKTSFKRVFTFVHESVEPI